MSNETWKNKEEIRKVFGQNLTDKEFEIFYGIMTSLGANPYLNEIYANKYTLPDGTTRTAIFCGRDFYRRKAQELPTYDGHIAMAVYENDVFVVRDGIPQQTIEGFDRGRLLGAYCLVYRKDISHPYFVMVRLEDYDLNNKIWNKKKETMITKVAEAQGLRGAFQGVFRGTYDESEMWEEVNAVGGDKHVTNPEPVSTKMESQVIANTNEEKELIEKIMGTELDPVDPPKISEKHAKAVLAMFRKYNIGGDAARDILKDFGAERIRDLCEKDYNKVMESIQSYGKSKYDLFTEDDF